MGFFTRLSNGWEIAKTSFTVLNANKQLIIFPILSGISLALIIASFGSALFVGKGWDMNYVLNLGRGAQYFIIFLFYIVNYFIVVFFNMGLMHCARLYFDGEEVSVAKGLKFSASRIGAIFAWALFAATVGLILKVIQDNSGWLGKIVISLVGFVWSIATFFVIPVIAYENAGPYEALKRSGDLMKEKWGETIGANFSIGLVSMIGFLAIGVAGLLIGNINEAAGICVFVVGAFAIIAISSALHSIFVSAVYNHINGNINDHFDQRFIDGLFQEK